MDKSQEPDGLFTYHGMEESKSQTLEAFKKALATRLVCAPSRPLNNYEKGSQEHQQKLVVAPRLAKPHAPATLAPRAGGRRSRNLSQTSGSKGGQSAFSTQGDFGNTSGMAGFQARGRSRSGSGIDAHLTRSPTPPDSARPSTHEGVVSREGRPLMLSDRLRAGTPRTQAVHVDETQPTGFRLTSQGVPTLPASKRGSLKMPKARAPQNQGPRRYTYSHNRKTELPILGKLALEQDSASLGTGSLAEETYVTESSGPTVLPSPIRDPRKAHLKTSPMQPRLGKVLESRKPGKNMQFKPKMKPKVGRKLHSQMNARVLRTKNWKNRRKLKDELAAGNEGKVKSQKADLKEMLGIKERQRSQSSLTVDSVGVGDFVYELVTRLREEVLEHPHLVHIGEGDKMLDDMIKHESKDAHVFFAVPRHTFHPFEKKNPYLLELVDQTNIKALQVKLEGKLEFATISHRGITMTKGKASEFIRLEEWLEEYMLNHRISTLKVFGLFPKWKFFHLWYDECLTHRVSWLQRRLKNQLLMLDLTIKNELMDVRALCEKMVTANPLLNVEHFPTMTLEEFFSQQSDLVKKCHTHLLDLFDEIIMAISRLCHTIFKDKRLMPEDNVVEAPKTEFQKLMDIEKESNEKEIDSAIKKTGLILSNDAAAPLIRDRQMKHTEYFSGYSLKWAFAARQRSECQKLVRIFKLVQQFIEQSLREVCLKYTELLLTLLSGTHGKVGDQLTARGSVYETKSQTNPLYTGEASHKGDWRVKTRTIEEWRVFFRKCIRVQSSNTENLIRELRGQTQRWLGMTSAVVLAQDLLQHWCERQKLFAVNPLTDIMPQDFREAMGDSTNVKMHSRTLVGDKKAKKKEIMVDEDRFIVSMCRLVEMLRAAHTQDSIRETFSLEEAQTGLVYPHFEVAVSMDTEMGQDYKLQGKIKLSPTLHDFVGSLRSLHLSVLSCVGRVPCKIESHGSLKSFTSMASGHSVSLHVPKLLDRRALTFYKRDSNETLESSAFVEESAQLKQIIKTEWLRSLTEDDIFIELQGMILRTLSLGHTAVDFTSRNFQHFINSYYDAKAWLDRQEAGATSHEQMPQRPSANQSLKKKRTSIGHSRRRSSAYGTAAARVMNVRKQGAGPIVTDLEIKTHGTYVDAIRELIWKFHKFERSLRELTFMKLSVRVFSMNTRPLTQALLPVPKRCRAQLKLCIPNLYLSNAKNLIRKLSTINLGLSKPSTTVDEFGRQVKLLRDTEDALDILTEEYDIIIKFHELIQDFQMIPIPEKPVFSDQDKPSDGTVLSSPSSIALSTESPEQASKPQRKRRNSYEEVDAVLRQKEKLQANEEADATVSQTEPKDAENEDDGLEEAGSNRDRDADQLSPIDLTHLELKGQWKQIIPTIQDCHSLTNLHMEKFRNKLKKEIETLHMKIRNLGTEMHTEMFSNRDTKPEVALQHLTVLERKKLNLRATADRYIEYQDTFISSIYSYKTDLRQKDLFQDLINVEEDYNRQKKLWDAVALMFDFWGRWMKANLRSSDPDAMRAVLRKMEKTVISVHTEVGANGVTKLLEELLSKSNTLVIAVHYLCNKELAEIHWMQINELMGTPMYLLKMAQRLLLEEEGGDGTQGDSPKTIARKIRDRRKSVEMVNRMTEMLEDIKESDEESEGETLQHSSFDLTRKVDASAKLSGLSASPYGSEDEEAAEGFGVGDEGEVVSETERIELLKTPWYGLLLEELFAAGFLNHVSSIQKVSAEATASAALANAIKSVEDVWKEFELDMRTQPSPETNAGLVLAWHQDPTQPVRLLANGPCALALAEHSHVVLNVAGNSPHHLLANAQLLSALDEWMAKMNWIEEVVVGVTCIQRVWTQLWLLFKLADVRKNMKQLNSDMDTSSRNVKALLRKMEANPHLDLLWTYQDTFLPTIKKIEAKLEFIWASVRSWLFQRRLKCPRLLSLSENQVALLMSAWDHAASTGADTLTKEMNTYLQILFRGCDEVRWTMIEIEVVDDELDSSTSSLARASRPNSRRSSLVVRPQSGKNKSLDASLGARKSVHPPKMKRRQSSVLKGIAGNLRNHATALEIGSMKNMTGIEGFGSGSTDDLGALEYLQFQKPITYRGSLELLVGDLEARMAEALKVYVEQVYSDGLELMRKSSGRMCLPFACIKQEDLPSQAVVLGTYLLLTERFQVGLKGLESGNPYDMQSHIAQLQTEIDLGLQNLRSSKELLAKKSYMTLSCMGVLAKYFIEIGRELVDGNSQRSPHLPWDTSLKYVWKGGKSESGIILLEIGSWSIPYSFEYLGFDQRLFLLPLADRCFLHMTACMSGTAGGVVRLQGHHDEAANLSVAADFASALGKRTATLFCSPLTPVCALTNLLHQVCTTGCVALIPSLDQLPATLLATMGEMVRAVYGGIRAGDNRILLDGRTVSLNGCKFGAGIFATLLPYYHDSNKVFLPAQLKNSFRPVALMLPDVRVMVHSMMMVGMIEHLEEIVPLLINALKRCRVLLGSRWTSILGLHALHHALITIRPVLLTAINIKKEADKLKMESRTLEPAFVNELSRLFPDKRDEIKTAVHRALITATENIKHQKKKEKIRRRGSFNVNVHVQDKQDEKSDSSSAATTEASLLTRKTKPVPMREKMDRNAGTLNMLKTGKTVRRMDSLKLGKPEKALPQSYMKGVDPKIAKVIENVMHRTNLAPTQHQVKAAYELWYNLGGEALSQGLGEHGAASATPLLLVGRASSGKSTVFNVVVHAVAAMASVADFMTMNSENSDSNNKQPLHLERIYFAALGMDGILGAPDRKHQSGESTWRDGLLPRKIRRYAAEYRGLIESLALANVRDRKNRDIGTFQPHVTFRKLLILDGPATKLLETCAFSAAPLMNEDAGTRGHMLELPTGEKLFLPPHVLLAVETDDIADLSPSSLTSSRIIFLPEDSGMVAEHTIMTWIDNQVKHGSIAKQLSFQMKLILLNDDLLKDAVCFESTGHDNFVWNPEIRGCNVLYKLNTVLALLSDRLAHNPLFWPKKLEPQDSFLSSYSGGSDVDDETVISDDESEFELEIGPDGLPLKEKWDQKMSEKKLTPEQLNAIQKSQVFILYGIVWGLGAHLLGEKAKRMFSDFIRNRIENIMAVIPGVKRTDNLFDYAIEAQGNHFVKIERSCLNERVPQDLTMPDGTLVGFEPPVFGNMTHPPSGLFVMTPRLRAISLIIAALARKGVPTLLWGPHGSGKTTLLSWMASIFCKYAPNPGEIAKDTTRDDHSDNIWLVDHVSKELRDIAHSMENHSAYAGTTVHQVSTGNLSIDKSGTGGGRLSLLADANRHMSNQRCSLAYTSLGSASSPQKALDLLVSGMQRERTGVLGPLNACFGIVFIDDMHLADTPKDQQQCSSEGNIEQSEEKDGSWFSLSEVFRSLMECCQIPLKCLTPSFPCPYQPPDTLLLERSYVMCASSFKEGWKTENNRLWSHFSQLGYDEPTTQELYSIFDVLTHSVLTDAGPFRSWTYLHELCRMQQDREFSQRRIDPLSIHSTMIFDHTVMKFMKDVLKPTLDFLSTIEDYYCLSKPGCSILSYQSMINLARALSLATPHRVNSLIRATRFWIHEIIREFIDPILPTERDAALAQLCIFLQRDDLDLLRSQSMHALLDSVRSTYCSGSDGHGVPFVFGDMSLLNGYQLQKDKDQKAKEDRVKSEKAKAKLTASATGGKKKLANILRKAIVQNILQSDANQAEQLDASVNSLRRMASGAKTPPPGRRRASIELTMALKVSVEVSKLKRLALRQREDPVYEPRYAELCSDGQDLTDVRPGGYLFSKDEFGQDTPRAVSPEGAKLSRTGKKSSSFFVPEDDVYGTRSMREMMETKVIPYFMDNTLDFSIPSVTVHFTTAVLSAARALALPKGHLCIRGSGGVGRRTVARVAAKSIGFHTFEYQAGQETRYHDRKRVSTGSVSGFFLALREAIYYSIGSDSNSKVQHSLHPRKVALIISDPHSLGPEEATLLHSLLFSEDVRSIFTDQDLLLIAHAWAGEAEEREVAEPELKEEESELLEESSTGKSNKTTKQGQKKKGKAEDTAKKAPSSRAVRVATINSSAHPQVSENISTVMTSNWFGKMHDQTKCAAVWREILYTIRNHLRIVIIDSNPSEGARNLQVVPSGPSLGLGMDFAHTLSRYCTHIPMNRWDSGDSDFVAQSLLNLKSGVVLVTVETNIALLQVLGVISGIAGKAEQVNEDDSTTASSTNTKRLERTRSIDEATYSILKCSGDGQMSGPALWSKWCNQAITVAHQFHKIVTHMVKAYATLDESHGTPIECFPRFLKIFRHLAHLTSMWLPVRRTKLSAALLGLDNDAMKPTAVAREISEAEARKIDLEEKLKEVETQASVVKDKLVGLQAELYSKEKKIKDLEQSITTLQIEINGSISSAGESLSKALDSLAIFTPEDFKGLCDIMDPPVTLVLTAHALCFLMDHPIGNPADPSHPSEYVGGGAGSKEIPKWWEVKGVLENPHLLETLSSIDFREEGPTILRYLTEITNHEAFYVQGDSLGSLLSQWVLSLHTVAHVALVRCIPKKDQIFDIKTQKDQLAAEHESTVNNEVNPIKEEILSIEKQRLEYKRSHEKVANELTSLVAFRKQLADLQQPIKEIKLHCEAELKRLDRMQNRFTADALIFAANSAYCSHLPYLLRREVVAKLRSSCQNMGLDVSYTPWTLGCLGKMAQFQEWSTMSKTVSLPFSPVFVDAACLTLATSRWPLLVDPDRIAEVWLTELHKRGHAGLSGTMVQLPARDVTMQQLKTAAVANSGKGCTLFVQSLDQGLNPDLIRFLLAHLKVNMTRKDELIALVPPYGGQSTPIEQMELGSEFRLILALQGSEGEARAAIDAMLPPRARRNITVVWFGGLCHMGDDPGNEDNMGWLGVESSTFHCEWMQQQILNYFITDETRSLTAAVARSELVEAATEMVWAEQKVVAALAKSPNLRTEDLSENKMLDRLQMFRHGFSSLQQRKAELYARERRGMRALNVFSNVGKTAVRLLSLWGEVAVRSGLVPPCQFTGPALREKLQKALAYAVNCHDYDRISKEVTQMFSLSGPKIASVQVTQEVEKMRVKVAEYLFQQITAELPMQQKLMMGIGLACLEAKTTEMPAATLNLLKHLYRLNWIGKDRMSENETLFKNLETAFNWGAGVANQSCAKADERTLQVKNSTVSFGLAARVPKAPPPKRVEMIRLGGHKSNVEGELMQQKRPVQKRHSPPEKTGPITISSVENEEAEESGLLDTSKISLSQLSDDGSAATFSSQPRLEVVASPPRSPPSRRSSFSRTGSLTFAPKERRSSLQIKTGSDEDEAGAQQRPKGWGKLRSMRSMRSTAYDMALSDDEGEMSDDEEGEDKWKCVFHSGWDHQVQHLLRSLRKWQQTERDEDKILDYLDSHDEFLEECDQTKPEWMSAQNLLRIVWLEAMLPNLYGALLWHMMTYESKWKEWLARINFTSSDILAPRHLAFPLQDTSLEEEAEAEAGVWVTPDLNSTPWGYLPNLLVLQALDDGAYTKAQKFLLPLLPAVAQDTIIAQALPNSNEIAGAGKPLVPICLIYPSSEHDKVDTEVIHGFMDPLSGVKVGAAKWNVNLHHINCKQTITNIVGGRDKIIWDLLSQAMRVGDWVVVQDVWGAENVLYSILSALEQLKHKLENSVSDESTTGTVSALRFQEAPSSPELSSFHKASQIDAFSPKMKTSDVSFGVVTGAKVSQASLPKKEDKKIRAVSPTVTRSIKLMKGKVKTPGLEKFVQVANKNLPEPHDNFRLWILTPISRSVEGFLQTPGTLADPKALLKLYSQSQLASWEGHPSIVPVRTHISHIVDAFLYSSNKVHQHALSEESIVLLRALALVLKNYQEEQRAAMDEGQRIDISLPVNLMEAYLAPRLENCEKLFVSLKKMATEIYGGPDDDTSVASRVTHETKATVESELTSIEGNLLDDFAYTLAKFARMILDDKDVVDNFLDRFETAISSAIWLFMQKDK